MDNKKHSFYFFTVVSFFHLAANLAHPVTPTIFQDLNLDDYMFGVALGLMLVVNFSFSPFWGKIGIYISSRNVLLICNLGYALGQVFFALAYSEITFILARMFAGIFTGGSFVGVLTYIANTTDDLRLKGSHLIAFATIQSVFGAFGFFFGGMLGIISPYVAIAVQVIILSACAVAFRFLCHDDKVSDLSSIEKSNFAKEINPFTAFVDSKKFMNMSLAILLAVCALQNLGFTAFDQTFNYYVKDIFNFPSSYNGIIKGVMGLITLLVNSTLCAWMIKRTNVNKSVILVLFFCATSILASLIFDDMIPFIIFNSIFFAFNGMSIPMLQNLVTACTDNSSKENSNLLLGLYNALRSFGSIIGALASGLLYTTDPKYPFAFGFIAFAIATIFSVVYKKRS